MAIDYYAVLGVERDASVEEIKRAFRIVARESHPDANPDDPAAAERFRQAAEAYEVLRDPDRRARYDRGDTIDIGDLFGGGFGGLDDLLRSVFGEGSPFGGGGRGPARGRDVLVRTEVSLAEAAFGVATEVVYRANRACSTCGGDGTAPGSSRVTCSTCGGAGQVRVARRSFLGTMMTVSTCPDCEGAGSQVDEPCPACNGRGVESAEQTVKVEIPAGVSTGTRLRITGRGEAAGYGTASGDLFVEVVVQADERFLREGDDVVYHATLGLSEAALGTTVEIPLLDGGTDLVEIPAGAQPGWATRVRGEGIGRLGRRGRGDMIVVADVVVPVELSADEEDALRRYAELRHERPTEPSRWRKKARK